MDMNFETINLILLGVGLFFVLGGIFWGMVRGLKKTTFRLSWLLVTVGILFFATPLITKALFSMDISWANWQYEGTAITSVKHFISLQVAQQADLAHIVSQNPQLYDIAFSIVGLFINSILFVLFFWLVKTLLWPLWAILSAIFIKKKDATGKKRKKHRMLGMLVGIVVGLLISSVTLMPVMNVISLINKVEYETRNSQGKGLVSDVLTDDFAREMIFDFDKTYLYQMYHYTGLEQLNAAMFRGLTSTKIDKNKVVLTDDIVNSAKAYKLATQLLDQEIDFSTATQSEIETYLTTLESIVKTVFGLGIVNAIGDTLTPIVVDQVLNNPEYSSNLPDLEDSALNLALRDVILTYKTLTLSQVKTDMLNLIALAKDINDENIINSINVILKDNNKQELQKAKEISIILDANQELVTTFSQTFTNLNLISRALPIMLDAAIIYGVKQVDSSILLSKEGITTTSAHINTIISTTLSKVIATLSILDTDAISDLDNLNEEDYLDLIPQDALKNIGIIIDAILSYPLIKQGEANFNLLTSHIINELHVMVDDALLDNEDIPAFVGTNLKLIANNLANVPSFEDELEIYGVVFDNIIEVYKDATKPTPIYNLTKLGDVLDGVRSAKMFKNQSTTVGAPNNLIDVMMIEAIEYVKEYAFTTRDSDDNLLIPQNAQSGITAIFNTLKQNILNNTSYKISLPQLSIVLNFVLDDIIPISENGGSIEDYLLTTEGLTKLGDVLDAINSSILLNNLIDSLLIFGLDYASDNTTLTSDNLSPQQQSEVQDLFDEIIDTIKSNINEGASWKTELPILKAAADFINDYVINMVDESEIIKKQNLINIGIILDDLNQDSTIFKNTITKSIHFLIKWQVADIEVDGFGSMMNIVTTNMLDNLHNNTTISWETELGILADLIDYVINDIQAPYFADQLLAGNPTLFQEFGQILDNVTQSVLIGNSIQPIIAQMLTDLVSDMADDPMGDIVSEIVQNLNDPNTVVVSWEAEFMIIANFMAEYNNMGEDLEYAIVGRALDQLSGSSLITRAMINNLVSTFISDMLQDTPGLPNTFITALQNAIVDIVSFENEFMLIEQQVLSSGGDFYILINDGSNFDIVTFDASMLDKYDITTGSTPSALISSLRPELIKMMFDEISSANTTISVLQQLNNDVQLFAHTITNYASEINYLKQLYDLFVTNSVDANNIPSGLGTLLDTLQQNSKILFNTGYYAIDFMFDNALSDNGFAYIHNTLNDIKVQTFTQLDDPDSTLTYTQILNELQDLLDVTNNLQGITESYDAEYFGDLFNDIRGFAITGDDITADLAIMTLNTLKDSLAGHPNYVIIETAINDRITYIEDNASTVDYNNDVFNYIKTIINM